MAMKTDVKRMAPSDTLAKGKPGDMRLVRGNAAIENHAANGKELHLFESAGKGYVRYVGHMNCASHSTERVRDREGNLRKAGGFPIGPIPWRRKD